MKLPVSIIIPTLNEEKYLPLLLDSIKKQTMQPSEVIVADALSTDGTRKIAEEFGCKIVDGGRPSKARNSGARIATQPLLLFLDSDVVLPPTFLEHTIDEMENRKLDIASCYVLALSNSPIDRYMHRFTNAYVKLVNSFYPHAPGFCIFAKKWVHEKIGGFDEFLALGEDHNYVKRAKKFGRYEYLKSEKIPVSVRRLKKGRLKMSLIYVFVELYRLFAEVKKDHFNYEFGKFK
jgi:glycosyltransferase involved in cell wall biosynthesis